MAEKPTSYVLFFDGASRGNPGESSCAFVLFKGSEEIGRGGKALGISTNNRAEYNGLLMGLEFVVSKGVATLEIRGDSQLVISQMRGVWKAKSPELRTLLDKCREVIGKSKMLVTLTHIPRSLNSLADKIANEYFTDKN
jgi:ribonuclease HI